MQFSLDDVRTVAQLLQQHNLAEIAIESTDQDAPACRLLLRRAVATPTIVAPTALPGLVTPEVQTFDEAGVLLDTAALEAVEVAEGSAAIPAPLSITATAVGLFRELEPALKAGDSVRAKQVIGAVESLKVPNDIMAPSNGKILEVLATEGQGVEYGQVLMLLEVTEA